MNQSLPDMLRSIANALEKEEVISLLGNNIRHVNYKLRKPPSSGMKLVQEDRGLVLKTGRYDFGRVLIEDGPPQFQIDRMAEVFAGPEWKAFRIHIIKRLSY